VAGQKSKRKKRNRGTAPRAVPSARREQRAERLATVSQQRPRRPSSFAVHGERPPSPFGGLPVSELAIFAGGAALIVGFVQGGGAALIVGFVVCALGVAEITAREHFAGYRSHAMLLAAIPAVGLEIVLVETVGSGLKNKSPLLLAVAPVFLVAFWLLRRRFRTARQARIARPPGS
jgi:Flp pilus assembly protein TadB